MVRSLPAAPSETYGAGSPLHRSADSYAAYSSPPDDECWGRPNCTPEPMGGSRRRRHSGAMTILVAFDPQTLDRAPVRFAVAAARFADVPLVVASVRAGMTPAACDRDDVLADELERLRAELGGDRGIEMQTRVVQASTPAGVARALQRVIDEVHAGLAVVGS